MIHEDTQDLRGTVTKLLGSCDITGDILQISVRAVTKCLCYWTSYLGGLAYYNCKACRWLQTMKNRYLGASLDDLRCQQRRI
jgi:hypothetical protein